MSDEVMDESGIKAGKEDGNKELSLCVGRQACLCEFIPRDNIAC